MNFHTAGGEAYYDGIHKECSKESSVSKGFDPKHQTELIAEIIPYLSEEELEEWISHLEQERQRRKNNKHV